MNYHNSGLLQSKNLSKMIGEMAVIASVRTSSLGMTRLDKEASAMSDRAHGAKEGTGRTSACRLPGAEAAVKALKTKHAEAKAIVENRTSKWRGNRRLLMNLYIGEVSGAVQDVINEHDRMRDDFVGNAMLYINNAYRNLGSYNVAPPTQAEIQNAFSLSLELEAVPDISAFTTADSDLENSLKKRFEDDMHAAYAGAQKDLMARLAEPLDNLVNRMKAYEERQLLLEKDIDCGKTGTFKSTVITNVTDMGDLIRAVNVTNDPALNAILDKLDALYGIEHKDLVNHASLRADTAKRAADIRASLSAWL